MKTEYEYPRGWVRMVVTDKASSTILLSAMVSGEEEALDTFNKLLGTSYTAGNLHWAFVSGVTSRAGCKIQIYTRMEGYGL